MVMVSFACWLRYDAAIRAAGGGGEKNTIMWMPLGGQVNTLKGKQTERKRGQKLFLAAAY